MQIRNSLHSYRCYPNTRHVAHERSNFPEQIGRVLKHVVIVGVDDEKPNSVEDAEASFSPDSIRPQNSEERNGDESCAVQHDHTFDKESKEKNQDQGSQQPLVAADEEAAASSETPHVEGKTLDNGSESEALVKQNVLAQKLEERGSPSGKQVESKQHQPTNESANSDQNQWSGKENAAVVSLGDLQANEVLVQSTPLEEKAGELISEVTTPKTSDEKVDVELEDRPCQPAETAGNESKTLATLQQPTTERSMTGTENTKKSKETEEAKVNDEDIVDSSEKSVDKNDSGFPMEDNHAGLSDLESFPLQEKVTVLKITLHRENPSSKSNRRRVVFT
ncbi:unnamed protein product [Soboliphyme baturini]|uniref:Pecanex-like protein n=1 Tax=Soboliphyme baturini TaxID=241478 RepID=A0A183J6D4_9BILA|nr:unnamed protein product [Soboliphyme baturini]